jgi:hypothetical protein
VRTDQPWLGKFEVTKYLVMRRRRMSNYDLSAVNSASIGYDARPFPSTSFRDLFNAPSSLQTSFSSRMSESGKKRLVFL